MIAIKVSDKLVFTSLAYVLDREGVYEWMLDIRKHWNLDDQLVPVKDFQKWLHEYHPNFSFTKEAADYYGNSIDKFEIEESRSNEVSIEKLERNKKLGKFNAMDFEVELLMKKFGINPKYKNLVIKAIACGEVDKNDVGNIKADFDYGFFLESQELRFVVEKSYIGEEKREIDRDRGWFYKCKKYMDSGMSFRKSFQNVAEEVGEDEDKVKQQLKRYRKFIKR